MQRDKQCDRCGEWFWRWRGTLPNGWRVCGACLEIWREEQASRRAARKEAPWLRYLKRNDQRGQPAGGVQWKAPTERDSAP
jgi:hypothetical protein